MLNEEGKKAQLAPNIALENVLNKINVLPIEFEILWQIARYKNNSENKVKKLNWMFNIKKFF